MFLRLKSFLIALKHRKNLRVTLSTYPELRGPKGLISLISLSSPDNADNEQLQQLMKQVESSSKH
jgi:hypothetical protein